MPPHPALGRVPVTRPLCPNYCVCLCVCVCVCVCVCLCLFLVPPRAMCVFVGWPSAVSLMTGLKEQPRHVHT